MANISQPIEAVLRLNASDFDENITKSTQAIDKLSTSFNALKKSNPVMAIDELSKAMNSLDTVLNQVGQMSKRNVETFNQLANAIHRTGLGLQILQSDSVDLIEGVNTINNIFKAFQGVLEGTTLRLENLDYIQKQVAVSTRTSMEAQQQAIATLNANRNSVMGLITGKNQDTSATERNTQATIQNSSAKEKDVASSNKLTSATTRLGKAMSSLRMIGSLVGSMLAYNFAHKLLVATGETIHAKSEMEGYFKMLNFGQRDINQFNNALDRTVKQFQRVNKYALGETISSIGVEFNLTTKEMEKAMPVVSMITSEYLRAGRNVNEASLAVKDILQGEFQRLSRETGVKGKQLEEAGWSGDKNDVMGLLEALDKVGKSRNWDIFAEKANSLNDILTIIQNRFGEWSADMVYAVQPTIVGVFNMILGSAQKLAGALTGVWEWLNGDSVEGQVAKWSLLATAITTVVGAFISYRTGAGLVQIAQMGLKGTIASTVLGLEAETVATYGTATAIKSKILGLEAEKVATLSVKDAILSKVLGLNAEVVAQGGLKQGIIDTAFARELETMRLQGATTEEMLNTLAIYENQLAEKSSIGILSAHAMGLNMTTYATHGFTVALIEANTGMKASEIASMGLAKKIALLGASFGVPLAIVGAFTVALGVMAWQIHSSAQEMARFNNILKNGESIVKENREVVEEYTNRQEQLKQKLSETKEGTVEYYQIQEKLRQTNSQLVTANYDLENSYKALQVAVSSQKHYEEALTDMSIEHQHNLAEAYMNAGYSARESYEMANDSLIDANNGAEQLRQTLQKIKQLQTKGEENVNYLLGVYTESGTNLDDEETKKHLETAVDLNQRAQDSLAKALTDESFMGRLDGWFGYYETLFEEWINNIGATVQSGNWGAVFENVWKGIAHGFADLPLFKDFWGWVYDQLGVENYKGQGWDAFANIGNDIIKWMFDPSRLLGEGTDLSFISEWVGEFFGNISQNIIGFFTDMFSGINLAESITSLIQGAFSQSTSNIDFSFVTDIVTNFFDWLHQSLSNPSASKTISASDILRNVIDMGYDAISQLAQSIIDLFKDGLTNALLNIPVVGNIAQFLGLGDDAESDANAQGQSVGQSYSGGVQTGLSGLDSVINTALSGLGLDEITNTFLGNSQTITSTATSTSQDVSASFDTMKINQRTSLDNMVLKNTTAFNDMHSKSNASMLKMRDSTSQVTQQMTGAWGIMRDSIIASADRIKRDSETRFNGLSTTIGAFYRRIQNPSSWGGVGASIGSAGSSSLRSHNPSPRSRSVGRRVASGFGGGWSGSSTMSVASLKKKICPNGDCGNLFDGYSPSDVLDVKAFLGSIGGEHGFGGWDFHKKHYDYIKTKSDAWDTAPPIINLVGGIPTSTKFKVGEFNNGTPKVSFSEFQSIAESIFRAIPYRLYYDSSWKGSWLGALQAGACNCYDGALALIALANTFGFSGSLAHGSWTDPDGSKTAHVWAVINGVKMDTTGMQQRGTWNPSASAGGSPVSTGGKGDVNISVVIEGDVYGVDDLNSKMEEGIDKALEKHFNKSYAVGI